MNEEEEAMILSQIIAKDQLYDVRIPLQGHYSIKVEITDGKITFLTKEQKIKK